MGEFFAPAVGTEVIVKVRTEAAQMNEDGTVKYRAKNTVADYYPATPVAIKKGGFLVGEVKF